MKITQKKLNLTATAFFKASKNLKKLKHSGKSAVLYDLAGLALRRWELSLKKGKK